MAGKVKCRSYLDQTIVAHAENTAPRDDEMVVETELQRGHDLPERSGGLDIIDTGRRIAGGVVMRQHQPPCIKVEGATHRAPQRQFAARLTGADLELLGDEQALRGEKQHHHAFLPAAEQPPRKVLPERAAADIGYLAQQGFACGDVRQVAGGDNGGSDRLPGDLTRIEFLGERLCRRGIDRVKRAEALDQAARNLFAALADEGT